MTKRKHFTKRRKHNPKETKRGTNGNGKQKCRSQSSPQFLQQKDR